MISVQTLKTLLHHCRIDIIISVSFSFQKINGDSKALDKKFRELESDAQTSIQNMKNELLEKMDQLNAPNVRMSKFFRPNQKLVLLTQ